MRRENINGFPDLPDLQILVRNRHETEQMTLTFEVSSPDPLFGFDSDLFEKSVPNKNELFNQRSRDLDYLNKYTQGIDSLEEVSDRENWIWDLGSAICRTWLPADLIARLKEPLQHAASLRILTEDPWIPWELLSFSAEDTARNHLGVSLAMGRWLVDVPVRSVRPVKNIAIIGEIEKPELFKGLLGTQDLVYIKPSTTTIREALVANKYDLIIFQDLDQCPAEPLLKLPHLNLEMWGPQNVPQLTLNENQPGPMIAFVGIASEKLLPSLSRTDGWARAFLKAGAGAFVGSCWDLPEAINQIFFRSFGSLLSGVPFGYAMKEARGLVSKQDPIGALAFVLYGDPLAFMGEQPFLPERLRRAAPNSPKMAQRPSAPARAPRSVIKQEVRTLQSGSDIEIGAIQGTGRELDLVQHIEDIKANGDIRIKGIKI